MAYYKSCPQCGCNLDPGERCECEEEREREQSRMKRMIVVGRGGQYQFNFTKEELTYGKIAI